MTINFGPNHPSTHGVLRLVVDLYGEDVTGLEAVIGYLHTGFEKNMEQKTWWKCITYPERIDYVSFQNNEYVFVGAVEKLLELEVPPKAEWMRTLPLRAEPHPLASRLARDVRARARARSRCSGTRSASASMILDLFEMVTGYRMHTRYFQVGGLAEDIPRGFYPEAASSASGCRRRSTTTRRCSTNKIWLERTEGLGLLSADDAIALGQSGPVLRASGVDWDLRRAEPYLAYDKVDFRVPVYPEGDVYARYRVHMARCASRCASSSSASTGSRTWRASRGSPTTARSSSRRGTSSTRRWSR